jgi:hypothetical protein
MKYKIATVTKNEYDLIEDFINYYGSIFGYTNVYIIDNGSTNRIVLDVYEKYKKYGLNVFTELGYANNSQGDIFTKYTKKYMMDADWVFGLDTDEFIVIKKGDQYHSENIPAILDSMLGKLHRKVDIIKSCVYNSIHNLGVESSKKPAVEYDSYQATEIPKYFYKPSNMINVSAGNHHITSKNNLIEKMPDIIYLHLHFTGISRHIERGRNICIGYEYINENDSDICAYEKLKEIVKHPHNGVHRTTCYMSFLKNKIILDLFKDHIKRMPTDSEFDYHCKNFDHLTIVDTFQNCDESKNNKNVVYNIENNKDKYDEFLYDKKKTPINHYEDKIIIDCHIKYLKSLPSYN